MASLPRQRYTPEQYLEIDRTSETKNEYFSGEIVAMAGASPTHNRITLNVGSALNAQLRGTPCQPFANDLRVKSLATGSYMYPDVVVVCGRLELENTAPESLLNPTLIVEVLSPSTEVKDRGYKFAHYRRLDSLREYVLIAQHEPHIERYVRQPDGQWLLSEANDLNATIMLSSIGCTLALSDVYDRVEFDGQADGEGDESEG
jgi:Uma2 family endonuclease